jgi:predicted aspartyl protease
VPILNVQFAGNRQNPDGTQTPLPPPEALQGRGPVIQVTVGLAQPFAQQLLQQGQAVPNPTPGWALIDTGASTTCVDDASARAMGLPAVDVAQMTSASHQAVQQNIYPIHVVIVGPTIEIDGRAMGAALAPQGIVALIGRDILQYFALFYNGTSGQITLSL